MNSEIQKALRSALYKVMTPMVRLLMRHGISYRDFADIARHVYVDVAEHDFALQGRKPTHARTAVLTGINRKDIAKLKERPHPLSDEAGDSPNPAAKIITGWLNDKFYLHNGAPLTLPLEDPDDGNPSFTSLAKTYCRDVPVRALLDELERIEAVKKNNGFVELVAKGYVPVANMAQSIRIFGTAASDLLSTMDHNIAGQGPGRFLQRTVSYSDIPIELLQTIREQSRVDGEALLLKVNEWLAKCDRQENAKLVGSGQVRAGIGVYYFEHQKNEKLPPEEL